MRFRSLIAPLLVLASVSSCGDDEQRTAADKWFAAYTQAMCDGYAKCCQEAGEPNDVEACRQFYGFLGGMSVSSAISNGATFDQAAGDQCLADLGGYFASCPPATSEPDSCKRVIVGTHAAGQPCSSNFDCAFGQGETAVCMWSSSSAEGESTGKCLIQKPAEEGKPCGSSFDEPAADVVYACGADPYFYCDGTSKTCKRRPVAGESCDTIGYCAEGSYCAYDSTTSNSTCMPQAPVGQPCTAVMDECVEEAYCDGATSKCVAKKPAGSPCEGFDECRGYCNEKVCEGTSGLLMCFTSD